MRNRTLAYVIEVMTAAKNGRQIQFRVNGHDKWNKAEDPCWNWEHFDYRIAPDSKPAREWKVMVNGAGSIVDVTGLSINGCEIITVREVL